MSVNLNPRSSNSRSSNLLRVVLGALVAFAVLMPLTGGFLRAQLPPLGNPAAPKSPADVLVQSGYVMLEKGNYQGAEETFRRARQLEPANFRAIMGVVEALLRQDKPGAALDLLRVEVENAPNRSDLQLALGNTAVRAGNYDLAIEVYQKILDAMDKNSRSAGDVYLRIGEAYRRKGDRKSAIASLQRGKEVQPGNPIILDTLAIVLESDGQMDEARAIYEQAVAVDPNNAVVLNNLAFLLAHTGGDLDQALTYAQHAKQLLPALSDTSDTLGWIYLKKNLSDNALAIFDELVRKEPGRSTYRYHLALALVQKGDRSAAAEQLRKALTNNPSPSEEEQIRIAIESLNK